MIKISMPVMLVAAAVVATQLSAPSWAQTAAAPAPQATVAIDEVIITARQRQERLIDVPVTAQVFTAADIAAAGIERPQDFIALTPGVSQVQTAEVGDMQVSIRGINTSRDSETNFALVIDGVLQTNPNALNQEFDSVTQIEVLKGPQGAVYGRNAVAGALILSTRKPTDQFAAEVGVGGGSDSLKKANVWIGGPLTDNIKASLSGYYRKTNGQWDNTFLKCSDCVDYFEEKGGTVRALFDVAGGQFDFKAKYSKLDSGAINFNASIALSEAAQFYGPAFYEDPNDHPFAYINDVRPVNEQTNKNFSLKGEWKLDVGTLTSYVAYNDQTNYFLTDGTSAAFQLYFPNGTNNAAPAIATCQASFNARSQDTPLNPPFNYGYAGISTSFLPPYSATTCDGYQYQQRDQKDTSVEVRLASPGSETVRWLGGLYYADIQRHVVVSQGSDLNQGFAAQAFVPSTGSNPTDLLYDDDFHSRVSAAFGQLAYDVAPGVEAALALRYDSEKRDVDNNVPVCAPSATSGPCYAQTAGFSGGSNPYINPAYSTDPALATTGIPSRSKTYSQLQPKLSVNWKITNDFAAYASYGYGFRSGGFNSTGSAATVQIYYGGLCLGPSQFLQPPSNPNGGLYPAACTPTSVHNITGVNDDYQKEVSKAAEAGFKSNLMDNKLQVNGSIFYTKVENMQFFNFFAGPFGLLRVVTNIDDVTLKGLELDTRWKANRYLTLFAGASWLDSKIDKYAGRPYTQGGKVPYAPDYTANGGVDFAVPISSGLTLTSRLDVSAVGQTWFHPVQRQELPNLFGLYAGFGQGTFDKMKRDPYAILNARLGIEGNNWGATAWSRNLTNKNYLAEIIPAPEFGGSFIHDAPGRSYGLDVSYRF
jgi:iron complex outermembrane receptor protein